MTYRLEPIVDKISSPIVIIFPDDTTQKYEDGVALSKATFDKHYIIDSIIATDDVVELRLSEVKMADTTWVGEEEVSFF